ncbi:MAG TPA: hypothetical protein VJ957_04255 [Longimicrobiales bacterium]|nr:hypothetical protein [Longimicrobiales bacterium]
MAEARIATWWVLWVPLLLVGCKDAAGPAVPSQKFSFKAQNEIQQVGTDAASAQVAVRFSVSLRGDVDRADIAKIQQVDILWPNNYVRTPILSGFQPDGDSLTATRLLTDRTEGLPMGTYTLEVLCQDGQQIEDWQYCSGNLLSPPTINDLTTDSSSVYLAWNPPYQPHRWRLYIDRVQPAPTTTVTEDNQGTANGGSIRAAFDYDFQPDEAYNLVMEMEDACNLRVIRFPIP